MSIESKSYMAVIVMNHYQPNEPQVCYNLDRPAVAMCEFSLHKASYDHNNKQVIKGEPLTSWRMSEQQWGEALISMNCGEGVAVTLSHVDGRRVAKKEQNVNKLDAALQNYLKNDKQLERFLSAVSDLMGAAIEQGSLSKSAKNEIIRTLSMFSDYIAKNSHFYEREVRQALRERVRHAVFDFEKILRNQGERAPMLLLSNSSAAEDGSPEISDLGVMRVSKVQSSANLFLDDATYGMVDIEMRAGQFKSDLTTDEASERRYVSAGENLFRLSLSASQYARLARANAIEVECTLTRYMGKGMERPGIFGASPNGPAVTAKNSPELVSLQTRTSDVIKMLQNLKTGKAALHEAAQSLKALVSQYADFEGQISGVKLSTINDMQEAEMSWLKQETEKHLALLPDAKREHVLALIEGVVSPESSPSLNLEEQCHLKLSRH